MFAVLVGGDWGWVEGGRLRVGRVHTVLMILPELLMMVTVSWSPAGMVTACRELGGRALFFFPYSISGFAKLSPESGSGVVVF